MPLSKLNLYTYRNSSLSLSYRDTQNLYYPLGLTNTKLKHNLNDLITPINGNKKLNLTKIKNSFILASEHKPFCL